MNFHLTMQKSRGNKMERNAFENAEFEGVPQAQGYVPPVVEDLEPNFAEPDFGEEPDFLQNQPVAAKAGGKPPQGGRALVQVERPMPGGEHPDMSITRFENQYMRLTGTSMSAEVRALMYGIMQENQLRHNDAAMALIVVQLYIAEKMKMLPHQVDLIQEKASLDTVKAAEKIVELEAKKTGTRLMQSMTEMIDERKMGGTFGSMKWAVPIWFVGFMVGNVFFKVPLFQEIINKIWG